MNTTNPVLLHPILSAASAYLPLRTIHTILPLSTITLPFNFNAGKTGHKKAFGKATEGQYILFNNIREITHSQ